MQRTTKSTLKPKLSTLPWLYSFGAVQNNRNSRAMLHRTLNVIARPDSEFRPTPLLPACRIFQNRLSRHRRPRHWSTNALVAQLDRVLPSEGRGRGFESRRVRHFTFTFHIRMRGERAHPFHIHQGAIPPSAPFHTISTKRNEAKPLQRGREGVSNQPHKAKRPCITRAVWQGGS